MISKLFSILLLPLIFISCSSKQPIHSISSTILLKTPTMKFYDKGFITKYHDHIHLQIFEVGHLALDLKIYKDEVCEGVLQCISLSEFNKKYLHSTYKDNFLYNLFSKNKIYHKDKKNKILIKVK